MATLDYLINECGFTPFRLFYEFGNSISGEKMSLTDYVLKVYEYFKERCDGELLKEKLTCDMLVSGTAVPKELITVHPLYKKAKQMFCGNVKLALLQRSGQVFVADRLSKKDLRGRFSYKVYDISILK